MSRKNSTDNHASGIQKFEQNGRRDRELPYHSDPADTDLPRKISAYYYGVNGVPDAERGDAACSSGSVSNLSGAKTDSLLAAITPNGVLRH